MKSVPASKGGLGLNPNELGALTGYTGRWAHALAWLREAWCSADQGNAQACATAIVALMLSHSGHRNWAIAAKVLAHGHDRGQDMAAALLRSWMAGAGQPGTTSAGDDDEVIRDIVDYLMER